MSQTVHFCPAVVLLNHQPPVNWVHAAALPCSCKALVRVDTVLLAGGMLGGEMLAHLDHGGVWEVL